MALDPINHNRVRVYVDLSDPRDVESAIAAIRQGRIDWIAREAAARAWFEADEEPIVDIRDRIEERTVGQDFERDTGDANADGE